jgi:hypothetical protein
VFLDATGGAELAERGGEEIGSDSQLARESADAHRLLGFLQGADDPFGDLGSLRGRLASAPGGTGCGNGLSPSTRLRRRGDAIGRRAKGGDLGERGVADGLDELVDELLREPSELSLEIVRRHGASDDITRGAAVVLGLDGKRAAA